MSIERILGKRRSGKESLSKHPSFLLNNKENSVSQSENINYATERLETYFIAKFCSARISKRQHTVCDEIDVNADIKHIKQFLGDHFCIVQQNKDSTYGVNDESSLMFSLEDKQWAINIKFIGDPVEVDAAIESVKNRFEQNPCFIRWVYDQQYLSDIKMPVNTQHLPFQEMYPYMEESLTEYYDRYINSSANVLLLKGLPGTGKTSFLRGLLYHSKQSATLTYHEKILEKDEFFVDWLESDDMFMILEDADTLLLPRKEGNNLMARFLNMGDGLMGFTNKKIIFSTNLPNLSDIDSALTRPGRCFDILEFRNLTRDESIVMCDKIGISVPPVGDSFSVSELFANKRNETVTKKSSGFGFI